MNLENLRRQRAAYYRDMQDITNNIGNDGMTPEAHERYKEAEGAFDALDAAIRTAERGGSTCAVLEGRGTPGTIAGLNAGAGIGARVLGARSLRSWVNERGLTGGVDEGDADAFSLARAIRGLATRNWQGAEAEQRVLGSGSDATGAVLIPAPLAANVIDMLTNESVVIEAGSTLVPMGSGTLSIPRVASGFDDAAWRDELDDVAEGDGAFERVSFKARTLAEIVTLPYEMVEDLTDEGAAIIEATIRRALGLKLDFAALYGTGTDKGPKGVRNQSGVTIEALAANGDVPVNYAPFTSAAFALRRQNVKPTGFVYSERTAETVASFADTTGQPLNPPRAIADLPHFSTNQVPDDLDVGTSEGVASDLFTADWSQLLIGVRPTLGIKVETHRVAQNMSVQILAYLRADVQLAHAAAFHVTEGVLATPAE